MTVVYSCTQELNECVQWGCKQSIVTQEKQANQDMWLYMSDL